MKLANKKSACPPLAVPHSVRGAKKIGWWCWHDCANADNINAHHSLQWIVASKLCTNLLVTPMITFRIYRSYRAKYMVNRHQVEYASWTVSVHSCNVNACFCGNLNYPIHHLKKAYNHINQYSTHNSVILYDLNDGIGEKLVFDETQFSGHRTAMAYCPWCFACTATD